MSYTEFGRRLIAYAASLGDVRARWIAVASWNVQEDWHSVKSELHESGFLVIREPEHFVTRRYAEKRDVADFLLIGQVLDEVAALPVEESDFDLVSLESVLEAG